MTAPLSRVLTCDTAVGSNDTTDVPIHAFPPAPFAGVVTAASFVPTATLNGAATNHRNIQIINTGQTGVGTTVVAQLALSANAAPTNLVGFDEKALPLSSTPSDLVVAAGDVLEFKNLHVGSGALVLPVGKATVTIGRAGAS